MPQTKSADGAPGADAPRRDPIAKLLDPLGFVVLTRERVMEAFDDAVRRGRMTRDDAHDLAATLINRSRQNADDLVGELEALLGRQRAAAAPKTTAPSAKGRRQAPPRAGLPIDDYDDLTAVEITSRLGDLTPAQLRRVRDHERRNANRKSVLQALERKLA
jgi:hypothetical protein